MLAYTVGSISSAILVCKLKDLPDPRSTGSYNPGATNVLRSANKRTAAFVLLFDLLKGALPVWGAYFLGMQPLFIGFIGMAACLGHMFPLFFDFKGGKAVATAFGVLLPIGFTLGAILLATWVIIAKITRYSSLAAIVTVSLAPLYTWMIKPSYVYPVLMLSALIILRHKKNISRLLNGTESKIVFNKKNAN